MADIVLIGGGVIGLSIAYELVGHGASVRVLDQGQLGQESSWAGAGMIPPGKRDNARTIEERLRAESFSLWSEWSARLLEETGIDNGFFNCGGIELAPTRAVADLAEIANHWRRVGVAVEELSPRDLRQLEPHLHPEVEGGVHLPEYCQVRNPRHVKALVAACIARGVELSPDVQVIGFDRRASAVTAVRTASGSISAKQFVVCSGAWSKAILAQAGMSVQIEPVRGQIVLLNTGVCPIQRLLEVGPRYLVPRNDGRILVGSTEEHVGFDKCNTADAISELIQFASDLVPALKSARFERCWSGLRPMSRTGLPYLGQVPQTDNLFVAAGHFRMGLTLSPITAVLLRQLLLDQPLTIPLDAVATSNEITIQSK